MEDSIVTVVEQMSRISAAFKYWRTPVTDVFNDSKFFGATAEVGLKWRPIITRMIDTDKSAMTELLGLSLCLLSSFPSSSDLYPQGKLTAAASSANIFTSRDYENQMRAMNIRRLSYILFSAEKNHYLIQLPGIQEKLVDLFKGNMPPNVESEVYLCIRVLLCRLSPHNLSSFWPVLLAELVSVFPHAVMDHKG